MRESDKATVRNILTSYLELNNHRKTPERYAILDAVYSMVGHFTLEELGRHRFQGTTRYEACYANNSHCHQVCTICGKVTEFRSVAVTRAIKGVRSKRFRKDGFSLYVYGVCSTCQAKLTKQQRKLELQKIKGNNESR